MDEDQYGLSAQFSFQASEKDLTRIGLVQSELANLEKQLLKTAKAVNTNNFGTGLTDAIAPGVAATGTINSELKNLASTSTIARKRIAPLKEEFRALKAEIRNIEFGDVLDVKAFKRGETQTRQYAQSLKELETQIRADTAVEREFIATLQREEKVLQNRIDLQRQQRDAAKSAQRVGEFQLIGQVGKNAIQPFVRAGRDAIETVVEFDDRMSKVRAASNANKKQMENLRSLAIDLGATTAFSAAQAAQAEVYLAQADFSVNAEDSKSIAKALPHVLTLASAGELELGQATKIATDAIAAFKLKAEDAARVANVLAVAANTTNTGVAELGEAFTYAAPQAKDFGASLEETAALLGIASNVGIEASMAGTALRAGLVNLTDATKQAKLQQELGVFVTLDPGNPKSPLRNIIDIVGDIQKSLNTNFRDPQFVEDLKKSQQDIADGLIDPEEQLRQLEAKYPVYAQGLSTLAKIFGKEALSFWTAQISQVGDLRKEALMTLASGVDSTLLAQSLGLSPDGDIFDQILTQAGSYQNAVSVIQKGVGALIKSGKGGAGAAEVMARIMEDNLGGALRTLDSSLEGIRLTYIEPLKPLLTAVINTIAKVFQLLTKLPAPIRFLISSGALLVTGMAGLAIVAGTVGVALFTFSQAAATASVASMALGKGLGIPLTGFFETSMSAYSASFAIDKFAQSSKTVVNDFGKVVRKNAGNTISALDKVYRASAKTARSFLLLSRSFLLSPIGIGIGSFVLLNALLEKIVPGFNLFGTVLSAIAAPIGFIWGLIKGLTESILEFLGVGGEGTLGAIAPIFTSIASAIDMAVDAFGAFSNKGEEIGKAIGNALTAPFVRAGEKIISIWRYTIAYLQATIAPLATFVQVIGGLIISALAENSPGTTDWIREKWAQTVEFIKGLFAPLILSANRVKEAFLGIAQGIMDSLSSIRVSAMALNNRIFGKTNNDFYGPIYPDQTKTTQTPQTEQSTDSSSKFRQAWSAGVNFVGGLLTGLIKTIALVNQAFIGIGDVSQEQKDLAFKELLQGTINGLLGFADLVKSVYKFWLTLRALQKEIIGNIVENLDLLSFALLTISSLPMTLALQLRSTAGEIIPELTMLIERGIPRAIAFALPGAMALAIALGAIKGFEQGFSQFLDTIPARLKALSDRAFGAIGDDLKARINKTISEGAGQLRGVEFSFDLDSLHKSINDFISGPLVGFIEYLHDIGDTARTVGSDLAHLLKPIITFSLVDFFPTLGLIPLLGNLASIPIIPYFSVITPFRNAIIELASSPAVLGLIQFLRGTVLQTALATLNAIATTLLYLFNIFAGFPIAAIVLTLTQEVAKTTRSFGEIVSGIGAVISSLVREYVDKLIFRAKVAVILLSRSAVNAISNLLASIPYVGEVLSKTFLQATEFLAKAAPRYASLIGAFFVSTLKPVYKQLATIYTQLFNDLFKGVSYVYKEGIEPTGNLLVRALDPRAAFKFIALYFRTQGFRNVMKSGLFAISPIDLLFGNRWVSGILAYTKLFSQMLFPANIVSSKVTEFFQVMADPMARARAGRLGVMVSQLEIMQGQLPIVRVLLELIKGLMLLSPIVQILGRIAFTTMAWYSILEPLNPEILEMISNTKVLGVSLAPVAKLLKAMRFYFVDVTEAAIAFGKQIPGYVKTIITVFNILGTVIGATFRGFFAVSSVLVNLIKLTIINPLTLIPVAVTAILEGVLIVLQKFLKFLRIEAMLYGYAIAQALRGNFEFLIAQLWLDLSDATVFILKQTFGRILSLIGAFVVEVVRIIINPFYEIPRLVGSIVSSVSSALGAIATQVGNLITILQLDKLFSLLNRFKFVLLGIGLLFLGISLPFNLYVAAFAAIGGTIAFLVYQYQTGFKILDSIINSLSNPIALLDTALKGMLGFLNAFVPPELADFIAGIAQNFIKAIPAIAAGIFLVALLIKRNIGEAFGVVVKGITGTVGVIMRVVDAFRALGEMMGALARNPFVALQLGKAEYAIRSREKVAGVANPFAYSSNPATQQQASYLGSQIAIAEAAMKSQKQFKQYYQRLLSEEEKNLVQMAKSAQASTRKQALGGSFFDERNKRNYTILPRLEATKDRFGREGFKLTAEGKEYVQQQAARRLGSSEIGQRLEGTEVYKKIAELQGKPPTNEQLGAIAKILSVENGNLVERIGEEIRRGLGVITQDNLDIKNIKSQFLIVDVIKSSPTTEGMPSGSLAFEAQVERFVRDKKLEFPAPGMPTQLENYLIKTVEQSKLNPNIGQDKIGNALDRIDQYIVEVYESAKKTSKISNLPLATNYKINDNLRANLSQKLFDAGDKDESQIKAVINEILAEVITNYTKAISRAHPDFANFEEAEKMAFMRANQFGRILEPIPTEFGDIVIGGILKMTRGTKGATDRVENTLNAQIRRVGQSLLNLTGIPSILEQVSFNSRVAKVAAQLEQEAERMARTEEQEAKKSFARRQQGLQFQLDRIGKTQAQLQTNLGTRLFQTLQNYVETGEKFRTPVDPKLLENEIKGFFKGITGVIAPDESPILALQKGLKEAVKNKEITEETFQQFRKYLLEGASEKGKVGLSYDELRKLSDTLGNTFGITQNQLQNFRQAVKEKGQPEYFQALYDVLGTGKLRAKVAKEDIDKIAAELRLSTGGLRQLESLKPEGFFAPIIYTLENIKTDFTDWVEKYRLSLTNSLKSIKSSVSGFPMIGGILGGVVWGVEKLVDGIAVATRGLLGAPLSGLIATTKGTKDYLNQLKTVKAFKDLGSAKRDAESSSLLEIIRTMGKGEGPKSVGDFMKKFTDQLLKAGIDKDTYVMRIVAGFLKTRGTGQTVADLIKQSEYADKLGEIQEAFAKTIGINVAQAAQILSDPKYTATPPKPFVLTIAQTLPKLFVGFASDIGTALNRLGGGAIARLGAFVIKGFLKQIVRTLSPGILSFLQTINTRITGFLAGGVNRLTNALIRIGGNNFITNALQGVRNFIENTGQRINQYLENRKLQISGVVQGAEGVFGAVTSGLKQATNSIASGGVWRFIVNSFKGLGNLIGGLFNRRPKTTRLEEVEGQIKATRETRTRAIAATEALRGGARKSLQQQEIQKRYGMSPSNYQRLARIEAFPESDRKTRVIGKIESRFDPQLKALQTEQKYLRSTPKIFQLLDKMVSTGSKKIVEMASLEPQLSGQRSRIGYTQRRVPPEGGQPPTYELFAQSTLLQKARERAAQMSSYFVLNAVKATNAWDESGKSITQRVFARLVKDAKKAGKDTKTNISHGSPGPARDIVNIYQNEVAPGVIESFKEIEAHSKHTGQVISGSVEQAAHHSIAEAKDTGQVISGQAQQAARRSTGFFKHASGAIGSFAKAGMGLGAAVSAAGYGLQGIGYSLVNLGIVGEDAPIIKAFNQFGEVMSIVGAVGAIASPILGSLASIMGGVISLVLTLGSAIASIGLIPFLLIASAAAAGFYLAFKTNFLGFADFINNTSETIKTGFSSAIEWVRANFTSFDSASKATIELIKTTWQGLVSWFSTLSFDGSIAANAQKFISGLSTHPIETIVGIWTNGVDKIGEALNSLIEKVQPIVDKFAGLFNFKLPEPIARFWESTFNRTANAVDTFTARTAAQGHEIQANLAEGSPGPTYYIRQYWEKTVDWVGTQVERLSPQTEKIGQSLSENLLISASVVAPSSVAGQSIQSNLSSSAAVVAPKLKADPVIKDSLWSQIKQAFGDRKILVKFGKNLKKKFSNLFADSSLQPDTTAVAKDTATNSLMLALSTSENVPDTWVAKTLDNFGSIVETVKAKTDDAYGLIEERYDYLKANGIGSIGELMMPGIDQIGRSFNIMGGDITDFAKRAMTSLLAMDFEGLKNAASDFAGNMLYALQGIGSGFYNLILSAIAFGVAAFTSFSPVILILGAMGLVAFILMTNFLGLRSILVGTFKVAWGLGTAIYVLLVGIVEIVKSVKKLVVGLFRAMKGDFVMFYEGVDDLQRAFGNLGVGLKKSLGIIGSGIKLILKAVGIDLDKIGQSIKDFWLLFRNGEVAGDLVASALINALKKIGSGLMRLGIFIKDQLVQWGKWAAQTGKDLILGIGAWFKWLVTEAPKQGMRAIRNLAFLFSPGSLATMGFTNPFELLLRGAVLIGKRIPNVLLAPFRYVFDFLKGFFGRIWQEIGLPELKVPSVDLSGLLDPFTRVLTSMSNAWLSFVDVGVNSFLELGDRVKQQLAEIVGVITGAFGGAFDEVRLAIEVIGSALESLKTKISDAIAAPATKVKNAWGTTAGFISSRFNRVRDEAIPIGQEMAVALSEGSPGPTFWIRRNWARTTAFINTQLREITTNSERAGREISTNLGNDTRSAMLSSGAALSNFAPQIAAPLFMLNDFIDAFGDLKEVFKNVDFSSFNTSLHGIALGFQSFITSSATTLTGFWTVITGSMLGVIGLVVIAVGGLYLAFKHNFLGIGDLLRGVFDLFKLFFELLFGGIFEAIKSVFTTIDRVFRGIFEAIGSVGGAFIEPFTVLFGLQDRVTSGFSLLSGAIKLIVDIILLPLRLVTGRLNRIIEAIGFIVQLIVPLASFIGKTIASLAGLIGIAATLAGIVAIALNFGAFISFIVGFVPVLISIGVFIAHITGAVSALAMTIGVLSTIISAVLSPAFVPILLMFGAALVIGFLIQKTFSFVAGVITGVFQGVWQAVSDVLEVLFAELGNIWNALVTLGQAFLTPFQPLLDMFGGGGGGGGFLGTAIGLVVKAILFPIQLIAQTIISIIRGISFAIQGVLLLGAAIAQFILTPFNLLKLIFNSLIALGQFFINLVLTPFKTLGWLFSFFIPKTSPNGEGSAPAKYATGGWVSGAGTSTGDRVPILASNGEFVVSANAASRNAPLLEAINDGEVPTVTAEPMIIPTLPTIPVASNKGEGMTVDGITFQLNFGDIIIQTDGNASGPELANKLLENIEPQLKRSIRELLQEITEMTR